MTISVWGRKEMGEEQEELEDWKAADRMYYMKEKIILKRGRKK